MIIRARGRRFHLSRRSLVFAVGLTGFLALALGQLSISGLGPKSVVVSAVLIFALLKFGTEPLSRVIARIDYGIRFKFEVAIAAVAILFLFVSLVHLGSMQYMHDELHNIQDLMGAARAEPDSEKRMLVMPAINALEDTHHGFLFKAIPALSVFGVAASVVLGGAMAWSVISPVRRMREVMARIGKGDFASPVRVDNRDEVGELSNSINRTAEELAKLQQSVLDDERARGLRERNTHVALAEEEERRRLSRELHDGLGPSLAAIGNRVRACRHVLRSDPDEAESQLGEIAESVKGHVREIRELIYDLRPLALDQLGLVDALKQEVERVGDEAGVVASFEASGHVDLDSLREVTVFRVVQESLANVRYHADAHRVAVMLEVNDSELEVSVEDDGRGFDPDHPVPAGIGRGVGLVSMRERAERLGGSLTVSSDHGRGCLVTLRVTLAEASVGAHTNPAG